MKIKNLKPENFIKYIYSFIKINLQDINKCNILFSCTENLTKSDIENCIFKSLHSLKLNNHLSQKLILKAFNYKIINNLSFNMLKEYTLLGNYDIGVLIYEQCGNINCLICAGNGCSLSYQKGNELILAFNQFNTLTNNNLNLFFKNESCKQSISPLNCEQIINRQKLKKIYK